MSKEVSKNRKRSSSSIGSLLRQGGRVAIWIVIALLLVRGLGAVLAPAQVSAPAHRAGAGGSEQASTALAVRFARAYLAGRPQASLAPLLAEEAKVRAASRRARPGSEVTQAEVSATEDLGGGRAILTVACEFRDGRTLYLAVPISRSRAGEVAVSGAPWVVAAPSTAGVATERPRPIAGSGVDAIGALVRKFIPAYLSAHRAGELSYLLAPGAKVTPLAGSLELRGGTVSVAQLGDGEGRRRTVVAAGRFADRRSGAVFRLAYRLELVRRDRWYVRTVEGALS